MPSRHPRKLYPIDCSPLFRIRGKTKFEEATGVNWDAVPTLLASDGYRVWMNKNQREIQAPIHWMGKVHNRLGNLFQRIQVPDYVYSQKGRSYVDNARIHAGRKPLIKTDVSKFYPSVTHAMVHRMFEKEFQCASDVANRLANICCYKQEHLPTGSSISGRVAYFSAKSMFDEIQKVALAFGCNLSIYVDDITISGDGATKSLLAKVRGIIRRHGFKSKASKSMTFASSAVKPVTGVIVTTRGLRLPNVRHKKLRETKLALQAAKNENERKALVSKLRGRQSEAKQILSS